MYITFYMFIIEMSNTVKSFFHPSLCVCVCVCVCVCWSMGCVVLMTGSVDGGWGGGDVCC